MNKKGNEVLKTAFKFISLKDRTEVELKEKLQKRGYTESDINKAILYLKQKGFIDDSKFIQKAERIAEDKFLGKMGLMNYLIRKGIDKEKLESLPPFDELIIAEKLLQRKKHFLRDLSPDKKRAKITGFLLRRGFSWETIKECLNREYISDFESPQNENLKEGQI